MRQGDWFVVRFAIVLVFEYNECMTGTTVDQVRATSVADLAASVLGLSDAQLLGLDAESAEAMVRRRSG